MEQMEQIGTRESCTCSKCRAGCDRRPGWMYPDQLGKIAKYLKMSQRKLFEEYLAIDWWECYFDDRADNRAYLIAPAIVGFEGGYYPVIPEGRCSFFSNERCLIHPVKPVECARAWCGNPFTPAEADEVSKLKKDIAREWQEPKPRSVMRRLICNDPTAPVPLVPDGYASPLGQLEALYQQVFGGK